MISFSVVVTASLSESECKGREFWDSGKMFGRFFLFFRRFSMNSDRFWAVCFGFAGISGDLRWLGGEGDFWARGIGEMGQRHLRCLTKALGVSKQGTYGV